MGTVAWAFWGYLPEGTLGTLDVLPGGSMATITVAHGPTVEPASLAVIPGHIYWLEAGIPRTFAAP
jgi:hypothetical protein